MYDIQGNLPHRYYYLQRRSITGEIVPGAFEIRPFSRRRTAFFFAGVMMAGSEIKIYDTTLRDGMQGIEVSYTLEDKIQIAHMLDEMQVDYIEGGFPLSNPKELEFFKRLKNDAINYLTNTLR